MSDLLTADWLAWTLVAIAVLALCALIARIVVMYRNMKREKQAKQPVDVTQPMLTVCGENFAMSAMVNYTVGKDGQIAVGVYKFMSADDDAVTFTLNNALQTTPCTLRLSEGDSLCASRQLLIKPSKEQ